MEHLLLKTMLHSRELYR